MEVIIYGKKVNKQKAVKFITACHKHIVYMRLHSEHVEVLYVDREQYENLQRYYANASQLPVIKMGEIRVDGVLLLPQKEVA